MKLQQILKFVKINKLTVIIAITNCFIFFSYASFEIAPYILLHSGGNFAPFTLDTEPYRLLSSMFLHWNLLHLIANMYSLFYLGSQIEAELGSRKFIIIYLVTGIFAGYFSLVFNLFIVSAGASGAIFGLYGYFIMYSLERSSLERRISLIFNFLFYFGVLFLFGREFNFDNAAHIGGVIAGVLLGLLDRQTIIKGVVKWSLIGSIIPIYFLLPRYQVEYFNAFQYLIKQDQKIQSTLNANLPDEELLKKIREIKTLPDSIQHKFENVSRIPKELQPDTVSINLFTTWKSRQLNYFITCLERESYIYLDSIEHAYQKIEQSPKLKYSLNVDLPLDMEDSSKSATDSLSYTEQYYNEEWLEVSDRRDASYYRIGYKDSLGEWEGQVFDYYMSGAIQMKGRMHKNLRDGIFIYYNEDSSYQSAGRYVQDNSYGKWENYYENGQLAREIRFQNGTSFIENSWDSLGNPLVVSGNGTEVYRYPNGEVRFKRTVKEGLNEGYVEGYYEDGAIKFKEFHDKGDLVQGIYYDTDGSTYTYDRGTMLPFPKGGYDHFNQYVFKNNELSSDSTEGIVHLRFDVHSSGKVSDIRLLKRMGSPFDEYAIKLLKQGPEWYPAMEYGHKPVNAIAEVVINF